jgi:adenylosuccinate synthase
MRSARVVIGAGWGDEGKGLLTDFLSDEKTLVVRFNGGAQAGHTVETPDGRRHVFHHIGSGAFRGAATFLSRFFVHNPLFYREEIEALHGLGVVPRVLADPRGLVTTPYDMMLNQIAEEARGDARHGSCGLGLNETITRAEALPDTILTVRDLADGDRVAAVLREIRARWVPRRLAALGIIPTAQWQARLANDGVLDAMLAACEFFAGNVTVNERAIETHAAAGKILFEGAQGLLLDEKHRWFPYVTRSRTGLTNVDILAKESGIGALDVTYVTRAYATRHGAGPFPREVAGLTHADPTNVPNPWQGTLRFGDLDLDLLAETIREDLARTDLPIAHGLAITCLDQVGKKVRFWHAGELRVAPAATMRAIAHDLIGGARFGSFGPTCATIEVFDPGAADPNNCPVAEGTLV